MPDLEMFAQRLMCIFGDVAVILASTFSKMICSQWSKIKKDVAESLLH